MLTRCNPFCDSLRSSQVKTTRQRWEIDREFAIRRAESKRIAREKEKYQRFVYGRAQLGGLPPRSCKGSKPRDGLREAIERGRRRKER